MKNVAKTKLIKNSLAGAVALGALASPIQAAELEITVTNLTQGFYFTPFIIASHDNTTNLFKAGTKASESLQMMAEGGNVAGLETDVTAAGGIALVNPNDNGLLAPGKAIAAFDFDSGDHAYLSLTAMLLPTNDAFGGVDSWKIPTEAGTYNIFVNAYDAGTEANNELLTPNSGAPGVLGIPADPTMMGGVNGTGLTTVETNQTVHIHRGTLGDDSADGGKSDLDNKVHRWLNPVLKVTVTVK